MNFLFLPLVAAFMLSGCEDCDLTGYQAMRVSLVYGASAPPAMRDGGCIVYTDIPPTVKDPDKEGPAGAEAHIGQSVYECLTGQAAAGTDSPEPFYDEWLFFRIDGQCPHTEGHKFTYGCINYKCMTIDTNLSHIGPEETCPVGSPMSEWGDSCWQQFYAVLGHEVMHGWLGKFHK